MSSTLGSTSIATMKQHEAETISMWEYEAPYDFYNAPADKHDLAELLDPAQRAGQYFSVHAAEELIGFFQLRSDGDAVVVGLGLRPDLTGRGLGQSFLEAGLAFAREQFAPARFRLSVVAFNQRAVKVYERAGFVVTRTFMHETNGGVFSFVEMERLA